MKEQVGEFVRSTEWEPAFDKRDPNPSKNYGIHGMTLRFVLQGPSGAVQFVIYTNWLLRHVQEELDNRPVDNPRYTHLSCHPVGADIGYHWLAPSYDGQAPMKCDRLPGGECYYDGTSLGADEFLPTFIAEGEPAVWTMLENRYRELEARS